MKIFSHNVWLPTIFLLLLLPNNDLHQQFEDYVIELRCEKKEEEKKKKVQQENKFKNMHKAGSEFKNEMW